MKFQVEMVQKVNTGSSEFTLTKTGYVSANNKRNAFGILKSANRKWDFTIDGVKQVKKFDFESEVEDEA